MLEINKMPVRGFDDLLPNYCEKAEYLSNILRETAKLFGIREVSLPIVERLDLFKKGLGEETDIVSNEMFVLEKDEDLLCLRPEMTTSFIRSCLNNSINEGRFYYLDWCFRGERPQAGRRRQFRQFGVECIGNGEISEDIECLEFIIMFLKRAEINFKFKINSIGELEDRIHYENDLVKFFELHKNSLSEVSKERLLKKRVLRILDSKEESDIEISKMAPKLSDYISENSREKMDIITKFLKDRNVNFETQNTLVRGLDYYNDFVFEIISTDTTASNSAIGGGGRYNALAEQIGSKHKINAVGFGIGFDRILSFNLVKNSIVQKRKLLVAVLDNKYLKEGAVCSQTLRDQNNSVIVLSGNLVDLLKYANRQKLNYVIIIGEEIEKNELIIKNLLTGQQNTIKKEQVKRFFDFC